MAPQVLQVSSSGTWLMTVRMADWKKVIASIKSELLRFLMYQWLTDWLTPYLTDWPILLFIIILLLLLLLLLLLFCVKAYNWKWPFCSCLHWSRRLLFEVEVSHEQLTTVREAQSNQSTTLLAHFVMLYYFKCKHSFFVCWSTHKLCYQSETKITFIYS